MIEKAPLKGARLVYIPTGEEFTVLCSCPRSRPKHHTRAYIQRNLNLYRYPEPTGGQGQGLAERDR